jgi:hypothetical protein
VLARETPLRCAPVGLGAKETKLCEQRKQNAYIDGDIPYAVSVFPSWAVAAAVGRYFRNGRLPDREAIYLTVYLTRS